jgi:hypothetical protein
MSECIGNDCGAEDHKVQIPEVVELKDAPKVEEKPKVKMQYIFITLGDGRRGVFAGPELITKAELLLKPPVLADIVFSEPKEMSQPEEPKEVKSEETPKP